MTKPALPPVWILVAVQAVVSAASLVVEIVAGRMLAPYVGMSLYTWTSVIAVVLAGFSAGHWAGGRIAEAPADRALRLTGWALAGAALTTAAAVFLLRWGAAALLPLTDNAVVAIVSLSMAAFFLPSFFAGIPAPVLAVIAVAAEPARQGRALGAMFAAGAVGAIGGTLLAGFLFISWLGSTGTLVAVTVVYVASAALLLWQGRRAESGPVLAALGLALPLALGAGALTSPATCDVESRYYCLRTEDISADPERPVRLMVLDHLAHGISARDVPEVMFLDHTALLDGLARLRHGAAAFEAFVIGGGSFTVPRAWVARGLPVDITVAEIDPEVTALAVRDFWFDPASARVVDDDARRVLTRETARYDVIIGDAFSDITVPQHLVTQEFFALVASRMNPGGTFLMNVIDHTDRLDALAALVATTRSVFDVVEVWTKVEETVSGQRVFFILTAGDTPSPEGFLTLPSPDLTTFARLPDAVIDGLVAERGAIVLTDDFAPIDRMMGVSF